MPPQQGLWNYIPGVKPPAQPPPKPPPKAKGRPRMPVPEDYQHVDLELPPARFRRSRTDRQMSNVLEHIDMLRDRLDAMPSAQATPPAQASGSDEPRARMSEMSAEIQMLRAELATAKANAGAPSASSAVASGIAPGIAAEYLEQVARANQMKRVLEEQDFRTPEKQGEYGAVMGLLSPQQPSSSSGQQANAEQGRASGHFGSEAGMRQWRSPQERSAEAGRKHGHLGGEAGKQYGYLGGRPKSNSSQSLEEQGQPAPKRDKLVEVVRHELQPGKKEHKAWTVRTAAPILN